MVKTVSNKFALPENPTYREIERSDGETHTWPKNTTRSVDGQGQVNYMQQVDINEGIAIKWRVGVGEALGNNFDWPKGPHYVLKDWPKNYRMFIHYKGPQSNPRQDVYLFGSTRTAKFRSVPEFIPHAIWLNSDPTLDSANCDCKYCSKRQQREITTTMGERGIIPAASPSPSSSPSKSLQPRRPKRTEPSGLRNVVYAAVQRSKTKRTSDNVLSKHPAPVEQMTDLRAMQGSSALPLRRCYRNDELVWAELEIPIVGSKGGADVIKAWPAIVEEASTRVVRTPGPSSSQNGAASSHDATDTTSLPDYDPNAPPWKTTHFTKYKLKLLGTSSSILARDDQVLPYQAYLPPTELIYALQEVPLESIRFDPEYTSNFTPVPNMGANEPPRPPPTFEESTGPYAFAIQIGSQIAGFWGLTDDWDFKYQFRPEPPSQSRGPEPTLQEVIAAAGNSNALNEGPGSSYGSSDIHGNRVMSTEELERTKASTLGTGRPQGQWLSQKNFHGLWWGAERIWTGDVLRLKMGRNAIAKDGAPHILPPSPAGPAALEHHAQQNSGDGPADPNAFGAGSRGVFMRLDSLFTVDVDVGNGRKRAECRAAGRLYELADLDWDDPAEKKEKSATPHELGVNGASGSQYVNGMSNALPQASPLMPSALPNPDPSVPIDQTAPQVLSDMLPGPSVPGSELLDGLPTKPVRPVPNTEFNLPAAPVGFKFRPILEEGYEAVFSLTLLSGRYYPGILQHPLLNDAVDQAFTEEGLSDGQSSHLWALEGLEPGFANSVDPIRYKKDRMKMLVDGEHSAREQLKEHLETASSEVAEADEHMENGEAQEPGYEMEVDQLINDQMQVDS